MIRKKIKEIELYKRTKKNITLKDQEHLDKMLKRIKRGHDHSTVGRVISMQAATWIQSLALHMFLQICSEEIPEHKTRNKL